MVLGVMIGTAVTFLLMRDSGPRLWPQSFLFGGWLRWEVLRWRTHERPVRAAFISVKMADGWGG